MILLIRQVLALYPDAKIVFKLHYDSINSKKSPDTSLNRVSFKFHYASINSGAKVKLPSWGGYI